MHRNTPETFFVFCPRMNRRGLTLVELMIVVAIIGVLGTIAIATFSTHMQEGKLTEMEHWATDVERGQARFHSDNHTYLDPDDPDGGAREYSEDNDVWTQVLEFDPDVPDEVTISADAGGSGDGCDGNVCVSSDIDPSGDGEWWAVRVQHDDADYDVLHTSELNSPTRIQSDDD